MASKKDIINKVQELGHNEAVNTVKDFLDNQGIDLDGLELRFIVKDVSKVKWKPKSEFVKIFIKELEKLDNKVITFEMLGILTFLTPYINYEDNTLINKDGSYMNQNDIINLSGLSRKKVNHILNVLIENEIIFAMKQTEDKRKSKYLVNPKIFYKGQKIDRNLKEYFDNN
jgi:hypothetical protein